MIARYTAAVGNRIHSPMQRICLSIALALFAFAALSACGNKGPLVLPDKVPEQQDKDKKKEQLATAPQPAAKAGDAASPR